MYRYEISIRQVVAVAPVATVVVPATRVTPSAGYMLIEAINDDLAQTLNLTLQKSNSAVGPWSDSTYSGLRSIGAGVAKMETVDVRYLEYFRVVGVASGAGLSARISAILFTPDTAT